jgi:N-methylhydantoinase B
LLVYTPQVQEGVPAMLLDMYSAGWGARPNKDGVEGVTPMAAGGATRSLPAEMIERECPVLIEGFGFMPDTGGAGQFRGALSVYRKWRFLDDGRVMVRTCRVKSVPYGLAGGKDGTPFQALLSSNGTRTELPRQMLVDTPVRRGEILLHVQPGAGGYGDPFARNPAMVLEDVLDGKISPAYAEREYGVVIDVAVGKVDVKRTATMRQARPAVNGQAQ